MRGSHAGLLSVRGSHGGLLSTAPAGRREVRLGLAALAVASLLFIAAAPFAKVPLAPIPALVPVYATALVICDLITAALLFGQFKYLRSPGLLVLAGGYLFTGLMTVAYALVFPGLFSPNMFGAGPQSTFALYLLWHGGFPLAVVAYALLKTVDTPAPAADGGRTSSRLPSFSVVAAVLAMVCGITFGVTAGQDYLPEFMLGDRTTDLGHRVLTAAWLLSLAALATLLRRRPYTVLDLWLMVVMGFGLFDLALAAVLNGGRFDLGWYVGRLYGLLSASALLFAMLTENGKYHARLQQLSADLTSANKALEQLSLHDGLTELPNRRFFDRYLDEQNALANRNQRPLALILCDIDAFKAYNDHYGHQAGDECLRRVAAAIARCCRRPGDKVARYGGEEFAMILPDTSLTGASQFAEDVRKAVARLEIPHEKSGTLPFVSISGGFFVQVAGAAATPQQLIAEADRTLYAAKLAGRNRMLPARAESVPAAPLAAMGRR